MLAYKLTIDFCSPHRDSLLEGENCIVLCFFAQHTLQLSVYATSSNMDCLERCKMKLLEENDRSP